jgi:hypothetical protein
MVLSAPRTAAFALSMLVLITASPTFAATPSPKATPHALPTPKLPTTALHAEFLVEVNSKGQVAHVKSAKGTGEKDPYFNMMTLGNVEQMWIRHPDGSAEVGLYKVTYDYDPKTHKIARNIAIMSSGGNWGGDPGMATQMINDAQQRAQEEAKREGKSLPPLQSIVGPSSSPSAKP